MGNYTHNLHLNLPSRSDMNWDVPINNNFTIIDNVVGTIVGGTFPSFADAEVPFGLINGINKVFILANTPNPAKSLQLFNGGLLQDADSDDYTLVENTITFTQAPDTGVQVLAWYRY